jgi:hypothetical protein
MSNNSRIIVIAISALLVQEGLKASYKGSTRGLTIIKPNKKQSNTPKKAVKPKGKNYTSKMKAKPNSVRKDFNQRRR